MERCVLIAAPLSSTNPVTDVQLPRAREMDVCVYVSSDRAWSDKAPRDSLSHRAKSTMAMAAVLTCGSVLSSPGLPSSTDPHLLPSRNCGQDREQGVTPDSPLLFPEIHHCQRGTCFPSVCPCPWGNLGMTGKLPACNETPLCLMTLGAVWVPQASSALINRERVPLRN